MYAIMSKLGLAYNGFLHLDSAEEAMSLVQAANPQYTFWIEYYSE